MKPAGSTAVGTSSVISRSVQTKTFINADAQCQDIAERGYLYCRNTCFRAVTFGTSPTGTENFVLRVTDATDSSKTFDFPGFYYYETMLKAVSTPDQRNSWIQKFRYFAPALPAGSYNAVFVDTRTGQASWPSFVERTVEKSLCSPSLNADGVVLNIPMPTVAQCGQLVQNGDMEQSNDSYPYWLQQDTGIEVLVGAGIGGSNAIADTVFGDYRGYIGQFIDTRCLVVGRQYNVQAWVRLANPSTKAEFTCNAGGGNCPSIQLRYRVPGDPTGQSFAESVVYVASSFVRNEAGWNLLQGSLTIDSNVAGAASVALIVRRGVPDVKMYLDNISMLQVV